MTQSKKAVYEEFTLDPAILHDIIKSQAGTEGKAVLETVMNSVDAGATSVTIVLTANSFSIEDDGKGFGDLESIQNFFKVFGKPHQEGDAKFGRYRMGRGQIMAFSKNQWFSSNFSMEVDVKNTGLGYLFRDDAPFYAGCKITGEWYDTLTPSKLNQILTEIKHLCEWTPIPVILNGERISLEASKEKWTLEDEFAYYKFETGKYLLSVYNQGVMVKDYSASLFGVGGFVISKNKVDVNFARNDIMAKCPVWQHIQKVVRNFAGTAVPVVKRDGAWRHSQFQRFLESESDGGYSSLIELPLLTDVKGRHTKLSNLVFGGHWTVAMDDNSIVSQRLADQGTVRVLSSVMLQRAGVRTVEAFVELMRVTFKEHRYHMPLTYVPFEEASQFIHSEHRILTDKELTAPEKKVFQLLKNENLHNREFPFLLSRIRGDGSRTLGRKLLIGESETALAWTDGETYVALDRQLLKISGAHPVSSLSKVVHVLLHEFVHQGASDGSHEHDFEFYRVFHDVTVQRADEIAALVQRLFRAYAKELGATKHGTLKVLDAHFQATGTDLRDQVEVSSEQELEDSRPAFELVPC